MTNGKDGDDSSAEAMTIKTINGSELKFFVGTQAQYDALTNAEKENLYAIITDDKTLDEITGAIDGLKDGSVSAGKAERDGNGYIISETYAKKGEEKPTYINYDLEDIVEQNKEITIGNLPNGKTIEDIIGIGINMEYLILGATLDKNDSPKKILMFSAVTISERNDVQNRIALDFSATAVSETYNAYPATASVNAELYNYGENSLALIIRFYDGFYSFVKKDDKGVVDFVMYPLSNNVFNTCFKIKKVSVLFA